MLGSLNKDIFVPEENYNSFYEAHKFEPLDEHTALHVDLVLPRAAWAVDVADEIEAESLLDLCCLDGFVALTLANKLGISATGVDLSEPGIKLAKERAHKFQLPAQFFQMAIEDYNGSKVDMITLFEAIEHFTDVDKVMEVIKQHLKPGGTLLVSTPDAEGHYGIRNIEDICHLQVYSYRQTDELPTYPEDSPVKKPVISLPDYIESQGFIIEETAVWNELVSVRAKLKA